MLLVNMFKNGLLGVNQLIGVQLTNHNTVTQVKGLQGCKQLGIQHRKVQGGKSSCLPNPNGTPLLVPIVIL